MKAKIRLEVQLDCGCWVGHGLHDEGPLVAITDFEPVDEQKPGKRVSDFFKHAAEVLNYWFYHRLNIRGHQCELVSPENPNGLAPNKPRQPTP